jgi:hypothetical protein
MYSVSSTLRRRLCCHDKALALGLTKTLGRRGNSFLELGRYDDARAVRQGASPQARLENAWLGRGNAFRTRALRRRPCRLRQALALRPDLKMLVSRAMPS